MKLKRKKYFPVPIWAYIKGNLLYTILIIYHNESTSKALKPKKKQSASLKQLINLLDDQCLATFY